MYKISFNGCTISTTTDEQTAIGLALNLHQVSNIEHSIFVEKEDTKILTLLGYAKTCIDKS